MIPILFDRDETSFTSNGLGRLADCVECLVTEERNGIYECEFTYPVTGQYFNYLEPGMIIYATHDDSEDPQPFIIYASSAPISGLVTFYAHHISYKLNDIVVEPYTAVSCAAALLGVGTNSINDNPFTFWTDKSVTADFAIEVPTAARAVMGGEENSILEIYGGEYEFDMYNVKLHASRGSDTQVEIRYGKNLVDITAEKDITSMFDAVVPFWTGTNENDEAILVLLSERMVVYNSDTEASAYLTDQDIEIVQTDDATDIVVGGQTLRVVPLDLTDQFEEQPTQAQLRQAAQAYLATAQGWLPIENIEVDFVQLWQTDEYADYAPLQRVHLCDTVSVYYPQIGIVRARQKVVKTVYNTLLDRFDSMELGELQTTFAEEITQNLDLDQYATKKAVSSVETSLSNMIDTLSTQIDGKIETWYQATDPQSEWSDPEAHVGDLWCYTGTTTSTMQNMAVYRFTYDSGTQTGTWTEYNATTDLFDAIDTKTAIFYGTPSGTYTGVEVGDYLVDSTDGCTYRWDGSQWVKLTDYVSAIASLRTALESQIDAKVETWVQSSDPASSWTTAEVRAEHNGDLWLYSGLTTITVGSTSIYPQGVYQYDSSSNAWTAYSSTTDNLFDLADGKTTIFYGTTSGTYTGVETGDYLVDSTDGCTYRWDGSSWAKQTDYASAISSMQTTLNNAITNATQKITGGLGGYVYIKPDANGYPEEILIMNTNDYTTATKIWRWNVNGFGYSNTGYSGTYGTAITMDGEIVADYITTGTMNANIIRAGVLQDVNGNTSFDLATGLLAITQGSINLGNGKFTVDNTGSVVARTIQLGNYVNADTSGLTIENSTANTLLHLWYNQVYLSKGSSTSTAVDIGPEASNFNDLMSIDSSTKTCYFGGVDDTDICFKADDSHLYLFPDGTTGSGTPNLILRTSDNIFRKTSGSSRKIKKSIKELANEDIKAENLYNLPVVQFVYNEKSKLAKDDQRYEQNLPGFILEEMDEVYPVAIDKNGSDDPIDWRWNHLYLIPPMLKLIQEQHEEIEKLRVTLEDIKERIAELERVKK